MNPNEYYAWEEQQLQLILDRLNPQGDSAVAMEEPLPIHLKRLQEEDAAHIQELTARLQVMYQAQLKVRTEVQRVEGNVREEREAYEGFRSELQEVQNELKRMEALGQTQVFATRDLNLLTSYRRRLLTRKEEAVLGLGLSNRRLRQSEVIRDKLEVGLARTNNMILVYERLRSDYMAHHGQVCLDYAISPALNRMSGFSIAGLAGSKLVDERVTAVMQDEAEEVMPVLDGLELLDPEDQERRVNAIRSLEADLSQALKDDMDDAGLLRKP